MPVLTLAPRTVGDLGTLQPAGVAAPPILHYGDFSYGDYTYGVVNTAANSIDLNPAAAGSLTLTPNS